MTFWELIRVLTRRWVVVLIGAIMTAGVGLAVLSTRGVYFTRTDLVVQAPVSAEYPNVYLTQLESVIDTAGVLAKKISGPDEGTKYASPDVTLVGVGVQDGWSLRLRDTGGQWAANFPSQILVLDVVAPSREAVESRQQEIILRAQSELAAMQRTAGVATRNMMTVVPAPESTVIFGVGGSRPRALGMTVLLGVGLTVAVAVSVDRRRRLSEVLPVPVPDQPPAAPQPERRSMYTVSSARGVDSG